MVVPADLLGSYRLTPMGKVKFPTPNQGDQRQDIRRGGGNPRSKTTFPDFF
jgi:hypothetical protein